MGRIRTIKPDFHAHEELSALPAETHLFAAALLNYADDEGYFNANPVLLKAGTNPLRESDQTSLEEQVKQLEKINYVEIRRQGAKSIGWVVNFKSHQRVAHPTPSRLKDQFDTLLTRESLTKHSREIREPLRREGKGTEGNGTGKGKEQPPPAASGCGDLPGWIDRGAFERFRAMRKKNRKPVTDEAVGLLVKKLESLRSVGNDPNAVLDQSTMNGWQGLFPLDGKIAQPRPEATVGMEPSVRNEAADREVAMNYWAQVRQSNPVKWDREAPLWVKKEAA